MASTKNWFTEQGESRRGPFSASVLKRFPTEGDWHVRFNICKHFPSSYLAFKFILGMTAFLAFAFHLDCVLALQPENSVNNPKRYSSPDKKAQSMSLIEVKGLYKAAYARSSSPQEVQGWKTIMILRTFGSGLKSPHKTFCEKPTLPGNLKSCTA